MQFSSEFIVRHLFSIPLDNLRSIHLNPDAGHFETLVSVGHPVEEAEGKTCPKSGHHEQVVCKQKCSSPHTNLPQNRVAGVPQRVEY